MDHLAGLELLDGLEALVLQEELVQLDNLEIGEQLVGLYTSILICSLHWFGLQIINSHMIPNTRCSGKQRRQRSNWSPWTQRFRWSGWSKWSW